MISLFDTLEHILQNHSKSLSDIEWIGNEDFELPFENFIEFAKNTDDSWVKRIYPIELIVIGKELVLIRREFDHEDDERWLYINTKKPIHSKNLSSFNTEH